MEEEQELEVVRVLTEEEEVAEAAVTRLVITEVNGGALAMF